MSSADSVPTWRVFAWRGIQLDVPAAWELNAAEGDDVKGYCRLDDGNMARLEVRWAPAGDGPVSGIVDRFIKTLTKKGGELDLVRGKVRIDIPGAETESFGWFGDAITVTGLAVRCDCGRASLIRLFHPRAETFRRTAQRILGSFRDHAREGLVPWSVLDFRFAVPQGYVLSQHSLQAGRSEFDFVQGPAAARALRLGLAELVLERRTLLDWVRQDTLGEFRRSDVEFRETTLHGHPGVEAAGRERRTARFFRAPRLIRLHAWHCAESNALYGARWLGPADAESGFRLFADSLQCHDAQPSGA